MYTILMNEDKSLTTSIRTTLYQHEKLADQIQFLIPQKCGLVKMNECVAALKYINQGNISGSIDLEKDMNLYKNKIRYILPIDSELNYFSGDVTIWIEFTGRNKNEPCMITGESILSILPSRIISDNSNSLNPNKLVELENEIEKIKSNLANDLKLTEDLLQLTVDDEVIGEGVIIPRGDGSGGSSSGDEGYPAVDFNTQDTTSGSDSTTELDNVIEF